MDVFIRAACLRTQWQTFICTFCRVVSCNISSSFKVSSCNCSADFDAYYSEEDGGGGGREGNTHNEITSQKTVSICPNATQIDIMHLCLLPSSCYGVLLGCTEAIAGAMSSPHVFGAGESTDSSEKINPNECVQRVWNPTVDPTQARNDANPICISRESGLHLCFALADSSRVTNTSCKCRSDQIS
jgi:hypothetical protein